MNTTHLDALELRLSHERERLAKAKTERERQIRQVWVSGIEKEIASERKFLGLTDDLPQVSDDELLAELG
ncbi:MAG: hypothetical protein M0Z85_03710 [Gammaproteobacteria bacterium]|nr:hypothetical protein [Gammaproteobacteria bacterium]